MPRSCGEIFTLPRRPREGARVSRRCGMRASYDLFRRLQLRASLPEADHDGCALCGYEPGKKVCGACNQSLQRIKQPLRAEIYAHLVSIGDKARADALKRTVNVFKPESKAGRALATLRKR